MRKLSGVAASPGVAIGKAVCIAGRRVEVYRLPLPRERTDEEIERLSMAVEQAAGELQSTRRKAVRQLGKELASIFEAHLLVLEDPAFRDRIEARIRNEGVNAEWAVHVTSEELQKEFESFEAEHLRERGEDVRDVAQHLLRSLAGIAHHELSDVEGDVVIVADDLIPSEAVRLGRQRVKAFALERGGATSHSAIIARSLKIPLVTGVHGVTSMVTDDDPVVVDGSEGHLVLHPTQKVLRSYRSRKRRDAQREHRLERLRNLPTETRDGVAIELLANIDLPEEIDEAVRCGARGVGLYRSEFLFIERSPELPTEEQHLRIYRRLVEGMRPHSVVIRTFDLGGRKLAREVLETDEANPVLGLRGIRLTLARPDIFRVQLRALYRAGVHGDLRLMLPLVSALDEVRQFKRLCRSVRRELERDGLPHAETLELGVMIEVPAAVLIADDLAREVDFFSIGTNDLVQYSMAVDRSNEHVSHLFRPAHPAILRMIKSAAESAQGAGIGVSLCGEMASDPRFAPLLVGLGLTSLSITPRAIPVIKERLRGISAAEWREKAERCLSKKTADAVERYLARELE